MNPFYNATRSDPVQLHTAVFLDRNVAADLGHYRNTRISHQQREELAAVIHLLDVWDETRGGAKVLNINWASDGAIEVVSFRRGDWEQIILDRAKQMVN